MPNLVIENVDQGTVILANAIHDDEILSFPGADTYVEGTILARKQVADAVTASAFTGTGSGTISASVVAAGPVVPIVGAYVLTCTAAVVNGGVFKLEDPNGAIVATELTLTVADGGTTDFEVGGLAFTVLEGTVADFAVADFATMTVAADGNVVIFAVDGTGGAQVPLMVLTYDITTTGAADVAARPMISGRVVRERLVIDAGGTVTDSIVDQLRDYGIVAENVAELSILDNQ